MPTVFTRPTDREAPNPPAWRIRLSTWLRIAPPAPPPARPDRRRGPADRRRADTATRRHVRYRKLLRLEAHSSYIDAEARPPIPAAEFTPGQRVEVLLSLHDGVRDAIQRWEDRVFQTFMLTAGALLSALVFFVENRVELRNHRALLATAVLLIGAAVWMYLYKAAQAHARNGIVLTRIEAALGLCRPDTYLVGDAFFGYTGYWVEDARTPVLLLVHAAIVGGAALAICLY